MTQRIILFLIIQVLLFGGIRNIYLQLFRAKYLFTVWSFVICTWYIYLIHWYGPISIFASLGSHYVVMAHNRPWFVNDSYLLPSLLNALVLACMPVAINMFVFKVFRGKNLFLFSDIKPLLGHQSCFLFGLLGTLSQFIAGLLYSNMWIDGGFTFSSFSVLEKIILSGFLVFTIGPQISLLTYYYFRDKKNIPDFRLRLLIVISFLLGIYSFANFGQRAYVLIEILSLAIWIASFLRPKQKLFLMLLPLILFIGYTVTTSFRIQSDLGFIESAPPAAKSLIRDLSYRSHIGTDSGVLAARNDVLDQLRVYKFHPMQILPIEFASGMPAFVRAYLPAEYQFARFEVLVGNYYQSLDSRRVYVDLHDSKSQYFLIIFGAGLGSIASTLFWLSVHLVLLLLVQTVFKSGLGSSAFIVPASFHFLVFGTTPGEIFVFAKSAMPYLLLFSILIYFVDISSKIRSFVRWR